MIREVLARFATAITENCGITKTKNAIARHGAIFHNKRMEAKERHAMGKLTMKNMVVRTIIRVMKHRAQIKNRTQIDIS